MPRSILLCAFLATACGSSAPQPAPTLTAPEEGLQLRLRLDPVGVGQEREMCRFLKLENAQRLWVRRFELSATSGLHHTNVMALGAAYADREEPCFGFPDEVMTNPLTAQPRQLFGSSSQVNRQEIALPDGVAVRLDPGQQVVFNYHYINVGAEAVTPEIVLNLYAIPEAAVRHAANAWLLVNTDVHIPPREAASLTTECRFPFDVQIVSLAPHMHSLGRRLQAWWVGGARDGELLFATERWDDPRAQIYDPMLAFSAGEGIRFTCEWSVNTREREVTFGEKYEDEMCIVFGYAIGEEPVWGGVAPEYGVTSCMVTRGQPF